MKCSRAQSSATFVLLWALLASCATLRVESDRDAAFDAASVTTFAIAPQQAPVPSPPRDPMVDSELTHQRIRAALTRQLTESGLAPVATEDADVWVAWTISTREVWQRRNRPVPVFGGFYGGFGTVVAAPSEERSRLEATLIVDVGEGGGADTATTPRLLWRGWARNLRLTPNNAEARIDEAVRKILAAYPG